MRLIANELLLAFIVALLLAHGIATAQVVQGDVLGMHNLTPASGSSVTAQGSLGCTFCHAPHSGLGGVTPLWNQTLSKATYTPYYEHDLPRAGKYAAYTRGDQQPLPELP